MLDDMTTTLLDETLPAGHTIADDKTEAQWSAVLARDTASDDAFVYAVRTTGIYCRPSCASRRPLRVNASFHATPAAAEAAGFRACKRCHPASTASR